ncbi:hypothetical protein [Polyangium aurulentum]|uniref:hypothetical protein n=1 Tax=Polyangium aurulentum TaxID=2567896 RepID=UPI0010AE673B|nr:hypothetical protein [Polyangium aurulentum]UQA60196.1 hypothetical protein E8A73_006870 [Polyangium aurulentum]
MLRPSAIESFVQHEPFPPRNPLPRCTPADLSWLSRAAQGAPGAVVWPGLFPRTPAKLARLLLAAHGHFDPATVLGAALAAYGSDRGKFMPGRPREHRSYHAHDALACALVHPGISQEQRLALVEKHLRDTQSSTGERSRRKSWGIVRWAAGQGFLDSTRLPRDIVADLFPRPRRAPLAMPPAPRGNADALAAFAARWPRFRDHLARARAEQNWFDYPGIAEMGHDLFRAFACGCRAPWMGAMFEAIEHVLVHGDSEAQNLVVVGLFEAVQGAAYRAGAAGDAFEAALLPRSRDAWADLIEGWTGAGIRNLAAWRQHAPTP